MRIPSWQSFRPASGYGAHGYGPSRRSRIASFVASLLICAALFLMLLSMGAYGPAPDKGGTQLVAIDLTDKGPAEQKKSAAKAQASPKKQQQAQAAPAVMSAPPPVPLPGKAQWPAGFIPMKSKDYAAADISALKQADAGAGGAASGTASSAYGPGEGPGGVRLYNAEWYREPSRAEISGYMPAGRPAGAWALIACQTVEKFHVENCQEIDESPRGSGLARALRQASWQFLVRPPRENGKSLVGAWVRIRFDFRRGKDVGAEEGGADGG